MKLEEKLLLENKAWAMEKTSGDSDYFLRLSKGQAPKVLWIGCSDSRVPAEDITNSGPGEIFVHRNIANQVHMDEPNVASVVEYGVGILKVSHIIVCGHYECGGMMAALSAGSLGGNLDRWLHKIKETYEADLPALRKMEDAIAGANQLSEKNVVQQVKTLSEFDCVKKAREERSLSIHGWIFDLKVGLLKELVKE